MKLSVLVPVYNERDTIEHVVEQVLAVDLGDLEREVILVDDGSTDGSREVLASGSAYCSVAGRSVINGGSHVHPKQAYS